MQVEFKIKTAEIDKLMREVSKYGKRVSDAIEKETAYAAYEVQELAIKQVPVDTGRLKRSIQVQKMGRLARAGRYLRGNLTTTYLVGTNVSYARRVEFGSNAVQTIQLSRGFTYTGTQRAKPYLRPAYLKVAPGYQRRIAQILRTGR